MIIDTDEWISVPQYADAVGVNQQNILHYVKKGKLDSVRLGRDWLVKKTELTKWPLAKRTGRPRNT